ncbi:trehalase-like [Diorhabda carinulata]|uniref:trehalase-like n=1 Tax=Diorhabda carinulata TaxID=1163345 RepID=UPI0025A1AA38|nr:trehalase-like [Diorhabda carinulata]
MKLILCSVTFLTILQLIFAQHKQSCHSPVYCQGDLLHVVQTAKIFNDSKTFVDMVMINPVNETLQKFQTMMNENDDNPSRDQIQKFVFENFKSIGELEEWFPRDFKKEPKIIKEIQDPVIRVFAQNIINIWPTLTRKVSYHVFDHPETHSLIPVEHPFIIPGGRFKEYYYWDSYWILKGLLLSDMLETAKGLVQNLLSMVERFGFIPNGGRIYYLNRSQPPLLSLMVADYVKFSKDFEFIRQNINTLDKEIQFWLNKRLAKITKDGKQYELAHYDSESDTPRPESYLEDIETCLLLKSEEERYECYTDLKGGAESGWDFSSRWLFDKKGYPTGNLTYINTRRNIPADLNAFLYKAFNVMYKFNLILQNDQMAKFYLDCMERWKLAIENILWNEEDGTWYDYDLKLEKQRKYYFASNLTPLWAGAFDESQRLEKGRRSVKYLKKMGIDQYRGGIPTSLFPTGQQWDFPNAWSPYQNLIIIGLEKSGDPEAQELAEHLAHIWVNSNIKAFHENKVMFEKYSAESSGHFGGGGEYHIQAGFGWSNGCILELIHLYFRAKTRKYIGFH